MKKTFRRFAPTQFTKSDWEWAGEKIRAGKYADAIGLLERTRCESQKNNDNLVSFVEMMLTFLAGFDEKAVLKGLRERYSVRMREFFSSARDIDQYFEKCIAAQKRHHAKFSVIEKADRYVVTYDPCGSGGRLRRSRPVGETQTAYPWSWGKAGVPYYCCHCCVSWEIIATELNGYPVKITMVGDRPADPCIHLFYKKPELIPEAYFIRIGMKKDVKRFDSYEKMLKNRCAFI